MNSDKKHRFLKSRFLFFAAHISESKSFFFFVPHTSRKANQFSFIPRTHLGKQIRCPNFPESHLGKQKQLELIRFADQAARFGISYKRISSLVVIVWHNHAIFVWQIIKKGTCSKKKTIENRKKKDLQQKKENRAGPSADRFRMKTAHCGSWRVPLRFDQKQKQIVKKSIKLIPRCRG